MAVALRGAEKSVTQTAGSSKTVMKPCREKSKKQTSALKQVHTSPSSSEESSEGEAGSGLSSREEGTYLSGLAVICPHIIVCILFFSN